MKTPTVYDVAQRAGVSIATVSFAFRRPERVRPQTRELVLEAARELGYVPNGAARGLAQRRSGSLGLYAYHYLLPDTDNNDDWRAFPLYVDEVQRGVELACWERGYALMLGGGGASDGRVVTDIAGRVDALAVFAQTVPTQVLATISRRIPVVEISEPTDDDGLSHVSVDNRAGMKSLTEHLVTAHGLKSFAFVGEPESHDVMERFRGFTSALRAHKLKAPRAPESVRTDARTEAQQLTARWLDTTLPDAVVCSTDQQALAVIDALTAAGKQVPQDIAVTGFDGIVAGRLSTPTLTTVRQPMQELGRAAVELLLEQLDNPGPTHRQLPVELVLRASCGC